MKSKLRFSKDFIPLRPSQDSNPFTLKPKLAKVAKPRKRNKMDSLVRKTQELKNKITNKEKGEE